MKPILLATLLLTAQAIATDETPCSVGGCTDVNQQQGQTNANNPVFNSQPNMNMSGSNVLVQQAMDSFVRMGDIQCPSSSINLSGWVNRQNSETFPASYENRSDGWGVMSTLNIPIGTSYSACEDAQKMYLKKMEWSAKEDNIRMCVDMINNGFVVSDQMKRTVPELAFCDHIKKISLESPERYKEMITSLQAANASLQAKVAEKPSQEVVGWKEYRVRFTDYINGCNSGCNGEYTTVKQYLDAIRSNFGNEDYNIYAIPYDNDRRVSVYIRKNWLTYDAAEMVRQRFVVAGFPAKVQGVKGSEVFK